jgi:hypothetical protein
VPPFAQRSLTTALREEGKCAYSGELSLIAGNVHYVSLLIDAGTAGGFRSSCQHDKLVADVLSLNAGSESESRGERSFRRERTESPTKKNLVACSGVDESGSSASMRIVP